MNESKKHFEIERKYRLTEDEYKALPGRLQEAQFKPDRSVIERDTFFPVEKKGDMLRIRDEECDGSTTHSFTRKTWVETAGAKERSEHEEELSPFIRECILEIVQRIRPEPPLRRLSKQRSLYEKEQSNGAKVVVTLDYLKELGEHSGPYMEIELIIVNEKDIPSARETIQELATMLLHDERDYVRMSYQDMLADVISKSTQ